MADDLTRFDTPTICNALEIVCPERRGSGFTVRPLVCVQPGKSGAVLARARTATIRAATPSGRNASEDAGLLREYYRHVGSPPQPTLTVIEDLDPLPGTGAWWGEVHSHVHRGLGSLGVITNGSVRDLDQLAAGFFVLAGSVGPSHAHVHPVEVGVPVTVAGMRVHPGDWIHADRHGAVVVPEDALARLAAAAEAVARRERVLIEASGKPDFDVARLEALLGGAEH